MTINSSRSRVWDLLNTPGNMVWHPFVKRSKAIGGTEAAFESPPSVKNKRKKKKKKPWDVISYSAGHICTRWIRRRIPGEEILFDIGPFFLGGTKRVKRNLPFASVSWKIVSPDSHIDNGDVDNSEPSNTVLRISTMLVTPEQGASFGALQTDLMAQSFYDGVRDYLNSVLSGVKFFLETGKPVIPDQFGVHCSFSSPESQAAASCRNNLRNSF